MNDYSAENQALLKEIDLTGLIRLLRSSIRQLENTPPGSASFGGLTGIPDDNPALASVLAALATAANLTTHTGDTSNPHAVAASQIATDSSHRLVTDAQIAAWNAGGGGSVMVPAYWAPVGHGADATGYQGFTVRVPFGGVSARDARLIAGGTQVQFVLQGASAATATLDHMAIVERSGTGADGTTTPTEVTFASGGHGVVIPADSIVFSDIITYTIDPTKGYLAILDFNASVASSVRRSASAGPEYQKAATASWNSQTLVGASLFNYIIAVQAILVK